MVPDLFGLMMVFLVDVSIKDRDIGVRLEQLYCFGSVSSVPIPFRIQVEQRTMSENHDPRILVKLFQIVIPPPQLQLSNIRARVRNVIKDNEVNSFMIKGIIGFSEELFEGLPLIQAGIVFSGHKSNALNFQILDDVTELHKAFSPLFVVIGDMSQIASEHDEVRLKFQIVDCRNCLLQRP